MPDGTKEFINLTKEVSGINLTPAKRSLIYNRVNKRLKELNVDLKAYTEICRHNNLELQHLLDAITTNHTSWFREAAHFNDLNTRVIPQIIQKNHSPRLRIWCAACSSGEEPYSLAMRLLEAHPECTRWDIKILATDISQQILNKAKNAVYTEDDIQNINQQQRTLGFDKYTQGNIAHYKIKDCIRNWISFARLNLMDRWPMSGPFDIIFCRNVMIYFDEETRASLINRFAHIMDKGGQLYIGHTEGLNNMQHPFTLVAPSIYELN